MIPWTIYLKYILIISDHGFGPGTNNAFYPNKWLSHKGLLKWKEGAFSKSGINSASVSARMLNVIKRSLVKRLSRREKEWILKFLPGLRAKVQSYLVFSRIDWKHTRAFSDEMTHSIWINLKGREPEGTVEPGDDYEELREYIIKEMSQLKDPKRRSLPSEAEPQNIRCFICGFHFLRGNGSMGVWMPPSGRDFHDERVERSKGGESRTGQYFGRDAHGTLFPRDTDTQWY